MTDAPRPARRERERMRHRQEILDAARRVVAMRGIEGITVDEVAREAEFAVGSIYRHFASKEELLELVVADFVDDFVEDVHEVSARSADFESLLHDFVALAFRHFGEDQAVIGALMAAGPTRGPSKEMHDRMHARFASIRKLIDGVVERGQREGTLPKGDRTLMVVSLMGTIIATCRLATYEGKPPTAAFIQAIPAGFLDGFRAQRATKRKR